MKKVKQYLVLGLGAFGISMAKTIYEMGHEVMAVDSDSEKVEKATDYSTQAVQANITDESTLKSLGVRNYDAVIVAIGEDLKASILICMMLREMECPFIVAKANDNIHAKILRQLGVNKVIFPERDTGVRVAQSLVNNGFVDLMELTDDFRIAEIKVPNAWINRSLVEICARQKYKVNVLSIYREGEYIVSPQPGTCFKTNDVMVIFAKSEDINKLNELN